MEYSFTRSSRGGQQLVVSGYLFRFDKRVGPIRYWKCNGRDAYSCQATARTDDDILIASSNVDLHTHPDDTVEIARRNFKNDVKDEV